MDWTRDGSDWPNREHSRFVRHRPHLWHIQEAGTGPVLLLLHGTGGATHSWRDVFPILARDYRVVALDLPGQGFTRMGVRQRCSLDAMSQDISSLLLAEDLLPDAIIGHSAGAAIALRMVRDLKRPPKAIVGLNAALENFRGMNAPELPQGLCFYRHNQSIPHAAAGHGVRGTFTGRLLQEFPDFEERIILCLPDFLSRVNPAVIQFK